MPPRRPLSSEERGNEYYYKGKKDNGWKAGLPSGMKPQDAARPFAQARTRITAPYGSFPTHFKGTLVLNPAGASFYTIHMRMRLFVSLVVVLLESSLGFAAEPCPASRKRRRATPGDSEDPSRSGGPAIPPSKMDPGIERRPSGFPTLVQPSLRLMSIPKCR